MLYISTQIKGVLLIRTLQGRRKDFHFVWERERKENQHEMSNAFLTHRV